MKTALITGGTRGIGKAIALAFLQRGYEVVLNYCNNEAAAITAQEEFNMQGYCPVLLRADVSDEEQVKTMFKDFFSIYEKLDVLVNNAGVSLVKVIQDTSLKDWNRIFDVNVKSTFLCSRAVTDKILIKLLFTRHRKHLQKMTVNQVALFHSNISQLLLAYHKWNPIRQVYCSIPKFRSAC